LKLLKLGKFNKGLLIKEIKNSVAKIFDVKKDKINL
jgi:hypothetical protein